ncbi:hypothetical protein SteCoe_32719 [Stentor coeruleus]|uniref:Uncharacterized protein n=1 Tax=Stentor coeruleus TaxID=5963 RepID=A0A1R2AYE3_9CILI|nr:hypothetical protein SteCoe_32719 [Stentor coeruleus]
MKIVSSSDLQKFTPIKQSNILTTSAKNKESTPTKQFSPILNSKRDSTYNSSQKNPHRKTRSCQATSTNFKNTPSKSRFDLDAIPSLKIDITACKNEIILYNAMRQKRISEDKRNLNKEWSSAKKLVKQNKIKEAYDHELYLTSQRLEFNKMLRDKTKEIKSKEVMEKIAQNKEFFEAKKKLLEDSPAIIQDFLSRKHSKSIQKHQQLASFQIQEKLQKEEQRQNFLENFQVKKAADKYEESRLKKEREFEYISELAGRRNISFFNYEVSK